MTYQWISADIALLTTFDCVIPISYWQFLTCKRVKLTSDIGSPTKTVSYIILFLNRKNTIIAFKIIISCNPGLDLGTKSCPSKKSIYLKTPNSECVIKQKYIFWGFLGMFDLNMTSIWVKLNRFIVCVDLYLAPNHHHQLRVVDNYLKVLYGRQLFQNNHSLLQCNLLISSYPSAVSLLMLGPKQVSTQYWKIWQWQILNHIW